MFTRSRHVPGVNFAGLIHRGRCRFDAKRHPFGFPRTRALARTSPPIKLPYTFLGIPMHVIDEARDLTVERSDLMVQGACRDIRLHPSIAGEIAIHRLPAQQLL